MALEHVPAPPQHDLCVVELKVGQIDNLIIRIVFGEFADELSANRVLVEGKSSDKVYCKPVSTLAGIIFLFPSLYTPKGELRNHVYQNLRPNFKARIIKYLLINRQPTSNLLVLINQFRCRSHFPQRRPRSGNRIQHWSG